MLVLLLCWCCCWVGVVVVLVLLTVPVVLCWVILIDFLVLETSTKFNTLFTLIPTHTHSHTHSHAANEYSSLLAVSMLNYHVHITTSTWHSARTSRTFEVTLILNQSILERLC